MNEPAEQTIRFVAEGGVTDRLRARLAGPILVGSSWIVSMAASMGSRGLVHRLERVFGRVVEALARIRIEFDGAHLLDPSQQYVVASLHEGLADAIALTRLPLGLRFAVRDELFEWPGLGRYLRAARHPLVETSPSVASARSFFGQARQVVSSGDSLVVFPQGSILGIEVAFQPGALRLARHFGLPLLPVVLTGSHRVWEHPYAPTLRFGQTIALRVLPPIPADELDEARFREVEREMKAHALDSPVSPRHFLPERDGWWDGYQFDIDPDFPIHANVAGT